MLSRGHGLFLLFTACFTGASVLVLEFLGARVMAPAFGHSLDVWTAIISVTMLSLAAGYHFGGRAADRWASAPLLYVIIGAVGLWTFGLYGTRLSVLRSISGMAPRTGSLVGCGIFFFLPIAALATVGPFVVKLLTTELGHLGGRMGKVTAVSTIGSLLGAVLTGYVFIPMLGVGQTLLWIAGSLLVLSAIGLLLFGRRGVSATMLLLGLFVGGVFALSGADDLGQPHPQIRILEEISSSYAELKVVEDLRAVDSWGPMKIMFIGHGPHTITFERGEPIEFVSQPSYWHAVPLLPYVRPELKRILLIGLGGGKIVQDLVADPKKGYEIDVVEIDAGVADLAKRHFGFEEGKGVRLFVQDARAYVQRTDVRYDCIIMDAFGAGTAPFHLFSVEALQEMKNVLVPGGLFFMNYLGFGSGPNRRAMDSILRTTDEVFPHWRVFAGMRPETKHGNWSNYLVLASEKPVDFVQNPFDVRSGIPDMAGVRARWLVQVNREMVDPAKKALFERGGQFLVDPPFVELEIEEIERSLDIRKLFDLQEGELVTDDRNPLEPWNEIQNLTLRQMVFEGMEYESVFLGRND